MARGGINKALVKTARDTLLARGVRPSIDAVRVELGNTGSKSTILRYLRELSDPQASTAPVALEAELAHLVTSVAERLREGAQRAVAEDQARVEQAWQRHTQAQAHQHDLIEALKEQVRRLDNQVTEHRQRESALQTLSRERQAESDQRLQQITELQRTLAEREAQLIAQDMRNAHLKDSLEHYQEQQRIQREQERARHDQHIQQLSKDLRAAQSTLLVKQEELATLHRDNERLLTESRLAARQALADAREYAQARAEWEQLTHTHHQAQAHWQAEQADLRERLRGVLLRQRSEARHQRHEQRQLLQLGRLLVAAPPSA